MASSGPSGGSGQQGSTGTAEGVKALQNVKVAVGNIKTQLEPLLAVPWQTLTTGLKEEERAKLNVTLAYTLHSLYYVLLRSKGVDTKTHKVQGELERIKGYMTKLQMVKGKEPAKPSLRINQSAAGRMIRAGLAGEDMQTTKVKASGKEKQEEGEEEEEGEDRPITPTSKQKRTDMDVSPTGKKLRR